MKLGAVDFLQKPFTPRELRDVVYNVLERKSLADRAESEYKSCLELAKYHASKRQFDNAVGQVKKAIGINPSLPEAFNFLGELQETIGARHEAIKNYRVAIDLDPTYKMAKNNLDRATINPKSRPSLQ